MKTTRRGERRAARFCENEQAGTSSMTENNKFCARSKVVSMLKREREIRRIAKRFNRLLARTRNGHLKLVDRDGVLPPIIVPSTPSDQRSLLNLRADLRSSQA
jgi:hypothetical protein